jgi:hypothetical protein
MAGSEKEIIYERPGLEDWDKLKCFKIMVNDWIIEFCHRDGDEIARGELKISNLISIEIIK